MAETAENPAKCPRTMMIVRIYTDGSAKPNPGKGGWGAVIMRDGFPEDRIRGESPMTTNNQMELTAPLRALQCLEKRVPELVNNPDSDIEIFTDSTYLRNGITQWIKKWKSNGWKTAMGTAVKNMQLWQDLDTILQKFKVTWTWIPGHDGDNGNEIADALAGQRDKPSQNGGELEDKDAIIDMYASVLSNLNYGSDERRALLQGKGYCYNCLRSQPNCKC